MPNPKEKPTKEETCKVEWLAKICGLSARRIQQLTDEGTVPKVGRGEYPKDRAIAALFAHFQELAGNTTADIQRNKARQQAADATTAEVDAMNATGAAVLASDVEGLWEDAATRSRVVIETFPGLTELQRENIISALASIKLSAEEEA